MSESKKPELTEEQRKLLQEIGVPDFVVNNPDITITMVKIPLSELIDDEEDDGMPGMRIQTKPPSEPEEPSGDDLSPELKAIFDKPTEERTEEEQELLFAAWREMANPTPAMNEALDHLKPWKRFQMKMAPGIPVDIVGFETDGTVGIETQILGAKKRMQSWGVPWQELEDYVPREV